MVAGVPLGRSACGGALASPPWSSPAQRQPCQSAVADNDEACIVPRTCNILDGHHRQVLIMRAQIGPNETTRERSLHASLQR